MKITLQLHDSTLGWIKAAESYFLPEGRVRIEYDIDFASKYLGRKDWFALSLIFPVQLDPFEAEMPGFLVDLIPQGNGLRRIMARHGIKSENDYQSMLANVPLASPGNLRVLEPWEEIESQRTAYNHPGFSREEVITANLNFLEYMEAHGAPIGGTSGAAGGAPKFLLREDFHGQLHADGLLDDRQTKTAWLVKIPFTDSANSKLLSETEKKYYDVLRDLPLETGPSIEIDRGILFIRRFDRIRMADHRLHYFGLESFYSAHGISVHGAMLSHEDNLLLIKRHSTQAENDILEYIKRDLVFRALANTDNHGRNTSFIKQDRTVKLSPIYDVTAMRFFEGDFVVPLTRWTQDNQTLRNRVEWVERNTQVSGAKIRAELVTLRLALENIEALLHKHSVSRVIIDRSSDDRLAVQSELKSI